jgi:chromate reductase
MAETVKLLFFAGSTRQGSFNRKLARLARDTAQAKGFSADLLELSDYPMPIFNGDVEANEGPPEAARKLRAVLRDYQGIFIASPEYNASITPLLKNTLDWMSRVKDGSEPPLAVFQTRVFAIGGASPGVYGAMRGLLTLRQVLAVGMGALVLPEQIAVNNAASAFDEAGGLVDQRSKGFLDQLISRLGDSAKRFAQ